MTIAGMYETSGDWLFDVGMPGKSGIGGGIGDGVTGQGGARHLLAAARRGGQQRPRPARGPIPRAPARPRRAGVRGGPGRPADAGEPVAGVRPNRGSHGDGPASRQSFSPPRHRGVPRCAVTAPGDFDPVPSLGSARGHRRRRGPATDLGRGGARRTRRRGRRDPPADLGTDSEPADGDRLHRRRRARPWSSPGPDGRALVALGVATRAPSTRHGSRPGGDLRARRTAAP